MQAAAHTKGGFGGVPQKVGKEFVKTKRMAEGGVASLGNMTSSTPSTPNVPVQPTVDPRDPSKGGYGGQNGGGGMGGTALGGGNFAAEGGPIGPLGYKKGGQVTTRRVSTGSTSKKSSNW
jgi:hypothetical protein